MLSVVSSGGWLMSDLRLKNEAHTVCSALFLRVAYVESLLIGRGIQRV